MVLKNIYPIGSVANADLNALSSGIHILRFINSLNNQVSAELIIKEGGEIDLLYYLKGNTIFVK